MIIFLLLKAISHEHYQWHISGADGWDVMDALLQELGKLHYYEIALWHELVEF